MAEEKLMLAYLAGAIDSDGSISIRRSTYGMRKRKDRISPMFSPRISLRQTSNIVPNLLKQVFGGTTYIDKPAKNVKNGKKLYCYEAQNLIAENAIRKLLPYLKIKKPQAELVLQLQQIKTLGRKGHKLVIQTNRWGKKMPINHAVYSDEQLQSMLDLYLKVRALNDTRYDKLHWPQDLPLPKVEK